MKMRVVCAVMFGALLGGTLMANAATITSSTAVSQLGQLIPGQSVTTPAGGPWNNITFNFFSDFAGTPAAAGTLFLLSQEDSIFNAGATAPQNLSSSTAGYIAQSQSISGGVYVFAPSLVLQPSTSTSSTLLRASYIRTCLECVCWRDRLRNRFHWHAIHSLQQHGRGFSPIRRRGRYNRTGTCIADPVRDRNRNTGGETSPASIAVWTLGY